MSRILVREILVLVFGVAVSGTVAVVLQAVGKDWELVHGIVVPIAVCLLRLVAISEPLQATTWVRRLLHQVFMAIALIALLLFEMGVGLFAGAQGIPATVWVVVGSIGVFYLAMICLSETFRLPRRPYCGASIAGSSSRPTRPVFPG